MIFPKGDRKEEEQIMMTSDNARAGMQQAPARSLFNALGFTQEEMKKPMVGIVSSHNEIVPGHMNLDKIVEAVPLSWAWRRRAACPWCSPPSPSAMGSPWDMWA